MNATGFFKTLAQPSKFLFVTVLLLLFYTCTGKYQTNNQFDYLVFSQRWLPTACIEYISGHHSGSNDQHYCIKPQNFLSWAIHGLWPTQFNHMGPFFCNKSSTFDFNKLTSIESELNLYWPNIEGGKGVTSLWQHEWDKHGTCATQLESLNSEIKYFITALKLFKTFSVQKTLTKKGILPNSDKEVNVTDLFYEIKNAFGKLPYIHCISEVKTKQSYLSEIRLCFNKNLQLIDCENVREGKLNGNVNVRNKQNDCPLNTKVIYPQVVSPSLDKFTEENYSKMDNYGLLKNLLNIIRFLQWASI